MQYNKWLIWILDGGEFPELDLPEIEEKVDA
jgi:hypothetical protein